MSGPREGPNPLRPYYIPPSIGPVPGSGTHSSSTASYGSKPSAALSDTRTSLGSSARDLLSDLDYSEYLSDSSPSAAEVVKGLMDRALWKYTSVLLAQPFEVAKTVLQVQLDASSRGGISDDMRRKPTKYRDDTYNIPSDDSDPDEPSYFTSAAPGAHTPSRSPNPRRRNDRYRLPPTHSSVSPSPPSSPHPAQDPHRLPHTTAVTSVISHLWSSEGAWGIWKGTNSTFIHSVLLSTITAFVRSLLCAVLAVPDPGLSISQSTPPYLISMPSAVGGLDITSSPNPLISLAAAVSAAGIAGVILAPIDIVRTKLMLTPSTHPPRSLIPSLKILPSWILPLSITPVTLLHSTIPTLISASTPIVLRSRLSIDPILTPNMYAIATFASQIFELGMRLPIETVLRRGQMAVVTSPSADLPLSSKYSVSSSGTTAVNGETHTVVEVGPYKGLVGTVYHIVFEEGSHGEAEPTLAKGKGGAAAVKVASAGKLGKRKKGQGVSGLWRGWRVGMWGLFGVWGAATLGAGGKGGEF